MKFSSLSLSKGLSLLEIIIAIGVFGVLAAGLLNLVIVPLYSSGNVVGQEHGMYLGQEGIEAAKAIRNTGWSKLTLGAHGLASSGVKWSFSGVSDNSPLGCLTGSSDCYTRVVTVSEVSRTGTKCDGDIVTSGGCVDVRTRLVESDVTWTTGFGIAQALHYATYVTNWDNYSRNYDDDVDFSGATKSGTTVTGTGDPAVVTLAAGGPLWTPSGGSTVDSTNDGDWGVGNFVSSTIAGVGTPASIIMSPTAAWTSYAVPLTWSETTNTDFNDGTDFTNTAVADTGDLSAVVLNTAVDWAQRTAPQAASAYNDTSLFSTSFGFAVGDGGVIARWDGASWTAVSSTTTENLNGVAVVSTTDAWAVGANGKIMRWNGSAWSQHTDTGAQVFRDIRMVSASEGYAVGDTGVIYRWNGATWTSETSPTAESLTDVAGTVSTAAPGSITETTDTDFGDGTFSPTADIEVVGSGAAASVVLTLAARWQELMSPTANRLNSTHIYSSSLGFAVGGSGNNAGTISRWNGTSWTNDLTNGSRIFNSVRVTSTTNAWAVADRYSGMRRWNGTTWSTYTNTNLSGWGNNAMNSINCYDANNCLIVGAGGRYSRWNGTTWTVTATVTNTPILYDVHYLSSSFAMAVGATGRTYTWDGTTWTQRTQVTGTPQLNAVSCSSSTFCVAVSNTGTSFSWSGGATWTALAATGATQLNEVTTFSTTSAVAVGTDSGATTDRIYRWNGTTWSIEVVVPAAADVLNGLSFLSADYGVAVGVAGHIIEYKPRYPVTGTQTYTSSVLNAGAAASWGNVTLATALPVGTSAAVETQTSADGSTGWSAYAPLSGTAIASPRNQYLRYRVTLATTDSSVTPSFDAITLNYDTSAPTLFAVSAGGSIIARNGSAWAPVVNFSGVVFGGVACVSSADCWAVANGGLIYRWNGSAWTLFFDYGTQTFTSVSMASASLGWAVANGGIIYRWNGATWAAVTSPTASNLYGVSSVSSTFAVGVGAAGTIIEYSQHYAVSGTYRSSVFDGLSSQTWSEVSWDETLPGGTDITGILVETSTNGTTWAGGAAAVNCTVSPCNISTLTAGRYARYTVTETTPVMNRNITPRLESIIIKYNQPLLYDYYDLYMTSSTDGYAAGFETAGRTSGGIAHWDGVGWSNVTVPVAFYNGIGGSGPNDIWADDDGGDWMLHWNGSTWTHYPITALTGTSWMNDVKCLEGDSTNCRAAGSNGLMLRWNAGTNAWVDEDVGTTTATIQWMSYISANELFAVGSGGTILYYLNGTWSTAIVGPTTNQWQGIAMNSATDGWVVGGDNGGNNAYMRHWDGSAWNAVTLPGTPTTYELQNIYCLNENFCWAGGGYGTSEVVILKWDGTSWTIWLQGTGAGQTGIQTNPVIDTYRIKAIWADTTTHAWAVASNKGFLEFKANYPTSATWVSPAVDSNKVGAVWNMISWDTVRPPMTNLTIATRTGPTAVPDGSWSAWSAEYSDPGGTIITSPNGQYLQYRATFTSGNQVATASLDAVRIIHSALTPEPLYDIEGVAANDIWSVGDAGVLAHFNGTVWSLVDPSPTSATLRGIDMQTTSLAFAVGSGGTILRWDGTAWTLDPQSSVLTMEDLHDVEFTGPTEAWAVGTSGTIIRWNGTTWATSASGTAADLMGLAMVNASNGFAVGAGGVIRRWNGSAWATSTSNTTQNLYGANCVDMTFCAAVGGANGTIVMWNGTAWAVTIPSDGPLTSRLNGVGFQAIDNGWAVGDMGATIRWDGTSWTHPASGTSRNLYSVNYPGGGLAWITGEVGSIMSVSYTPGGDGTFLGVVLNTGSTTSVFSEVFFAYGSPSPSAITVAFRSGNVEVPDGTWTAWGTEHTLPAADSTAIVAVDASVSPNQYFQYRLTLSSSDENFIPTVDAFDVTYQ